MNSTKEFRFYKRKLPHLEDPGSVYFITTKVNSSLSLSAEAKDNVLSSIKFNAGKKYRLYACVIMETHFHLILQPIEKSAGSYYSIAEIMQGIKSYSSHMIKKKLDIKDGIWVDENYDRIVRDDKELIEKLNYIITNPVKAGIVKEPEDYKWLFVEGL